MWGGGFLGLLWVGLGGFWEIKRGQSFTASRGINIKKGARSGVKVGGENRLPPTKKSGNRGPGGHSLGEKRKRETKRKEEEKWQDVREERRK